MESERGRYESNAVGDRPGGQSWRATFDEQAVDLQAMLVGESAERLDYLRSLHGSYDSTTIFEMSR